MAMLVPSLMAPALMNAPVLPVAGSARAVAKMALSMCAAACLLGARSDRAPWPRLQVSDAARREGVGPETAGKMFDPLGFSSSVSDEAVMWFRHSELKHGRVAMAATVGCLLGKLGITFPGELAKGVSFASVGANGPFAAWDAVPTAGKLQLFLFIGALEWASETKKPHYMKGGVPGKIDPYLFEDIPGLWAPKIRFWDPLNTMGALSDKQKATKRASELKNGRLAMIAIASFVSAHYIPGSVPFLPAGF